MTNNRPLPDSSSMLVDNTGRPDQFWYQWFRSIERLLKSTADTSQEGKASLSQEWRVSLVIDIAANQDYIFPKFCVVGQITELVAVSDSGTCDVTVKIGADELSGGSTSVSSTRAETFHASEMADDLDLTVTISNNSSAVGVSITLIGTQTLEAS